MSKNGLIAIYSDKDLKTSVKNIKCPLHHVLKPGLQQHEAYEIIPNEDMKHFTKDQMKRFGLRNWKYKRDKWGNKIPNYRNHFQPDISAFYAKDYIYSPNQPTCRACRRCIQ